ncbi:multiple RNA-binding domain-containing protein 1 isoform X2 [Sesamum indicum]|nr:multiple RNA-binding domain-containing protein 1 isoform X2 [Sesamum indicum]
MPRPWSQHSLKKKENSSEEEKRVTSSKDSKTVVLEGKSKKSKNKKDDENDDPQLQEFLQVMQHRSRSKLWANDTLAAPSLEQSEIASANKVQMTKGRGENLDGEDTDLEGIKGEGTVLSEKQEADKPNNLVHDEVISDMDYFRSRIKNRWSDSESSDDEGSTDGNEHGDGDDDDSTDSQNKSNHGPLQDTLEFDVSRGEAEDGSSGEHGINNSVDPSSSQENKNEEVLESGRLFIRNLPYTATEEELEEHFSKYGTISQVHIVIDKDTRRSKGIAFVLFALPESAARALEEMDSSIFQGRLLHVMPAKQKNLSDTQQSNDAGRQSSKTFKQQRDAERKASEASGNTRAWNSLFMRPDTVVENVARKFGVSKSELLDKESDDLAVRIALGETQVISETKKALSNAGVNISSLEEFAAGKTDGLKRSNHVILVKNLPYGSSESELSNMFGKFGSLDRIVLPPTKTLALVIFLEPAEARAAFKGLAYKRYKDAPLYLEWAPGNILSQTSPAGDNKVVGEHDVKRALLEQEVEETADADVDLDRIESRSLYVKNLNFKTSDDSVKKHFTEHMKGGKILSIRVKKHVKNGKNVSMGFGFIEFDCVDTAVSVCRDLQGTVLDGHALILQLCHAKKDEVLPKKVETDISSTKLIVRNVAFEATEKDLRQLFSPFGQIKSLRLPMRFGKHRGFAFVEYVTKQEARNALQALSNTHLYGRHLVLERAKEGESLEELRARTAAQFTDSDSAKLSKKRKHLTVLDEGNIKFERIAE